MQAQRSQALNAIESRLHVDDLEEMSLCQGSKASASESEGCARRFVESFVNFAEDLIRNGEEGE